MTTKTITLFKSYDKTERDNKISEFQNKFSEFEIYRSHRQSRSTFEVTYEIKATGEKEKILKYLEEQETKNNTPVQKIIDVLKVELEPLRIMYHEKMQDWAKEKFARIEKVASMTKEQLLEKYGKEAQITINYHTGEEGIKKYIPSDTMAWVQANRQTVKDGLDKYLETAKKNAEGHYQTSLVRLAYRIESKGLNMDKLQAETKYSKVDVNITTILSDGEKYVKAWTIIASGEIQRPHYRYLVK